MKFNIVNKIDSINNEFISTFTNKDIYYKENEIKLNKDDFYSHVVSKVAYESKDYFYNIRGGIYTTINVLFQPLVVVEDIH